MAMMAVAEFYFNAAADSRRRRCPRVHDRVQLVLDRHVD